MRLAAEWPCVIVDFDANATQKVLAGNFGRGRDEDCSPPPAQIRTGPIKAYGSYLGCVTAKRTLGQG